MRGVEEREVRLARVEPVEVEGQLQQVTSNILAPALAQDPADRSAEAAEHGVSERKHAVATPRAVCISLPPRN
jgi:hypothetical protein